MRKELIEQVKREITEGLATYLETTGITFYIAANDNIPQDITSVTLEGITSTPIYCDKLVTEIRVMLGVLGKASECAALVEGLYNCLHPYQLTLYELNVLLMSMHVETSRTLPRRFVQKAVMRYLIEAEEASVAEFKTEREAEEA